MNFKIRLLALLLVIMMCLTSCDILGGIFTPEETTTTTSTTATTATTKPSPEIPTFNRKKSSTTTAQLAARYTLTEEEYAAICALVDQMVEGALPDPDGDSTVGKFTLDEVNAIYEEYEEKYYYLAEQYVISMIIYYAKMEDEEASTRYNNTMEMLLDLETAYTEGLKTIYKNSPYSAELFKDWTEEELAELEEFDPVITELQKAAEAIQLEYEQLDSESKTYNDDVALIYAKYVAKNNEIAKYYGYDNYYEYATKNVYDRDYESTDVVKFRSYVLTDVFPNLSKVKGKMNSAAQALSERDLETAENFLYNEKFDALKKNYVVGYLHSLTGLMGEYMRDVFDNKNCVFSGREDSHPTAFQTYLPASETPICFFGSNGQSSLTIVHEIGHYYAAKYNNDLDSMDLLETHSQGNEFLFLDWCEQYINDNIFEVIESYQVYSTLCTIVMSTIVDEFEYLVYTSANVENFTSNEFDEIMKKVCSKYGGVGVVTSMLADPNSYWRAVVVRQPVYYISYAISAVAALEIGALVDADREAGYTAYTTLVEGVFPEDGFVNALTKAGLYTPFQQEAYDMISEAFFK